MNPLASTKLLRLFCISLAVLACARVAVGQVEQPVQQPSPGDAIRTASTSPHRPAATGVIVVRPAAWAADLAAWKAFRTGQGYEIFEVDAELEQAGVQSAISQIVAAANARRTSDPTAVQIGYVLLVGDGDQGTVKPPLLPAWYRTSTAMVKFGGDRQLATDTPYADLDGDECPDLAIGRIPAESAAAMKACLDRSIAYEQQLDYGSWRRDVRVIAGVGGFGALADSAIEMTTSRFLTDRVPAWCDVSMTYASPNSPYCPDPYQFSEVTIDQLNAGSQFWVYIGHGHVKQLDALRVKNDVLSILTEKQIRQEPAHRRPPIALLLACYTGAFDAREDCLSEQMVMSPSGPVAAISATRVTGPYGLAALSSRMLDECYVQRTPALGDVFLNARRRMLEPDPPADATAPAKDAQMQFITAIASALSPAGHDLLAERQEHVWQMNLLGDPLLRLHYPSALALQGPPRIIPGESLTLQGMAPQAGQVTIEVAVPRDRTPRDLFTAGEFTADPAVRQKMQASFARANNRVLLTQAIELAAPGPFTCTFRDTADLAPGRYVVRVFIEGSKTCSAGALDVQVARPRKNPESIETRVR